MMTISVTDLDRWQLRFERTAPLFTDLPRPKGRRSPLIELGASLNDLVDFTADMGWLPDGTFPVRIDGRTYRFPSHIVKGIHEAVEGADVQREVTAIATTRFGDVRLVGIPDYVKGDTVVDLKYTEHYDRSWYMHRAWQRRAYPYILRRNGTVINHFVYYVIEHSKGTWRKHVIRLAYDKNICENALVRHIEHIIAHTGEGSCKRTVVRLYGEVIASEHGIQAVREWHSLSEEFPPSRGFHGLGDMNFPHEKISHLSGNQGITAQRL